MENQLSLELKPRLNLNTEHKLEIIEMCSVAYDEDFSQMFDQLPPDSCHVLARIDKILVGHAAWTTRWLQPEGCGLLRTAYVDLVATTPQYQHMGIGTQVMKTLASSIMGYEIGGLCAGPIEFYEHLGWERWLGPLYIRFDDRLEHTPDENGVMILRLPSTPLLNLTGSLSVEWRDWEVW